MVVFHSYVSLPEGNSDSHPFLLNSFFPYMIGVTRTTFSSDASKMCLEDIQSPVYVLSHGQYRL